MSTNRKVKPLAQCYQADANYIALRVSTDTQDVNADKMEKQRARMRAYLARHKDDPEFQARRRENNRKWYSANRERLNAKARQYRSKHPESIKERNKRYYAAHKADENARSRKYRTEHRDELRMKARIRYLKTMSDPNLYAIRRAKANACETAHKDQINAKRREWCRKHKRRMKMRGRLQRDRRNMLFRESPELYSEFREKRRVYEAYRRRIRGMVRRVYIPRYSSRIPNYCVFGRVLDTRSVFLWNNLPAASLVAGRAYRAMQWREIHCDRYGQVCR